MLGHGDAVRQAMRPVSGRLQNTPGSTRSGQTPADASTARLAAGRAQSRFRLAHLALLAEGLAVGVLGGVALAWSMANLRFGAEGTPLCGLRLTPLHGGLLMANGVLAVLVCLGRWPTVAFSAVATGGWATLAIVCAVRTAQQAPGMLGFDARDTVFYAALAAYNLAVCLWLAPILSMMWRATRTGASSPREGTPPRSG
jgi:hypothetical protein